MLSQFKNIAHTKVMKEMHKSAMKIPNISPTTLIVGVDPGTISMGVSIYQKDELILSEEIRQPSRKPNFQRIIILNDIIAGLLKRDCVNCGSIVLAIEHLRGARVHPTLRWMVGAVIQTVRPDYLLEIPYEMWKMIAPDGYEKTDKGDSELIARSAKIYLQEIQDA